MILLLFITSQWRHTIANPCLLGRARLAYFQRAAGFFSRFVRSVFLLLVFLDVHYKADKEESECLIRCFDLK